MLKCALYHINLFFGISRIPYYAMSKSFGSFPVAQLTLYNPCKSKEEEKFVANVEIISGAAERH